MTMPKIVAFGNPLLDTIVILQDDSLLRNYNLQPDDQREVPVAEIRGLLHKIEGFNKSVTAGGCAQNTLKILQWLLNKQCTTVMFGAIGDDSEGETLKNLLEQDGVKTKYQVLDSFATGVTVALVSNENRSLVACLGAAENYSLEDDNQELIDEVTNAHLVYIEGFFLTKRLPTAGKIVELCKKNKRTLAFNTCGEYLCREVPEVKFYIENADIVFGNRKEFETLCSVFKQTCVKSLLKHLAECGKTVIMTDGAQPVTYIGCGHTNLEQYSPPKMEHFAIVDTTGAGDSFVAGFLGGYLSEKNISKCVEIGCYTAQETIKQMGCRVPNYIPKNGFKI